MQEYKISQTVAYEISLFFVAIDQLCKHGGARVKVCCLCMVILMNGSYMHKISFKYLKEFFHKINHPYGNARFLGTEP